MHTLSDKQIKQRLQEGRNYKRLYYELKEKYDVVVAENKQLRQDLSDLTTKYEALFEAQQARIEELERMVYPNNTAFRKTTANQ